MSKKYVVDAEWLTTMLNMSEFTDGIKARAINHLTPAQERAGDEEEWVVVNKSELEGLVYGHDSCPGNRGHGCPLVWAEERDEYDCQVCWMNYLTTEEGK